MAAGLLVGLAPLAYVELRAHLVEQRARRLRAQAKPILDRRLEHLDGQLEVPALAVILAMDLTSRDTSALVIDAEGRVLGEPAPGLGAPRAPVLEARRYERTFAGDPHVTYILRGEDGRRLLVALIPPRAWTPRPPAIIQLTTDLGTEQRILRRLARTLAGGGLAIGAVALALDLAIGGAAGLAALAGLPLLVLASRRARAQDLPVEEIDADGPAAPEDRDARADFTAVMRRVEAAFLAQQASEERMRTFVADASHELRTPLTSLGGAADVLMSGAKNTPEHVERLARIIRAQADRMGGLVEDLLMLARLDSGAEMERVPVRLDRLVLEHGEELRLAAPERRLEIAAGTPATVVGDPERLRRAVANLTSNALRHTASGDAIRLSLEAADGESALTVSDDGDGIAPGDLPRIFERFYRGDQARSSTGTGLGLAIVREIVRAHGGRVQAHSVPGEGATFVVRLPLAPG